MGLGDGARFRDILGVRVRLRVGVRLRLMVIADTLMVT